MNIDQLSKNLSDFAKDRDWEQYHTPKNIAMALSVEASELVEIFQWLTAEESQNLSIEQLEDVKHEVGDVANYLIRLCDLLDLDLLECAAEKIEINKSKYPADKVRGSAAKYTEYQDD